MCGRYSFSAPAPTAEQRFDATFSEPTPPTYNAALSQRLPIITTGPNELMTGIHNRMPVILPDRAAELTWLADDHRLPEYQELFQPYESAAMREYVVDKRANSPTNNDADVLAPAAG